MNEMSSSFSGPHLEITLWVCPDHYQGNCPYGGLPRRMSKANPPPPLNHQEWRNPYGDENQVDRSMVGDPRGSVAFVGNVEELTDR